MIAEKLGNKFRMLKLKIRHKKISWRAQILREVILFSPVEIGQNCVIEKATLNSNSKICNDTVIRESSIGSFCKISVNVSIIKSKIDQYTYISGGSNIFNTTVGKFCSIGPGVIVAGGMHAVTYLSSSPIFYSIAQQCGVTFSTKQYFEESKPVVIGNDVWIGANAYISDGIEIGDGCIIGAGAVVTKSIEPYSVVGGVPAKVIKKRFDDNKIKQLQDIQWWKWSEEKIIRNLPLFQSSNFNLDEIK